VSAELRVLIVEDSETDAKLVVRELESVGHAVESARVDALRVSEARYRRIIETTKQGVWTLDAQAKTTFVSPSMARMLGTETSEVLGRRLSDFISPEFHSALEQQMAECGRGEGVQYETRFLRKDGSTLWMLVEASPIYGDSGQFEGSLGMALDLTERKRADDALRASEAQVRLLLDSTGEAIYGIDLEGNCTFANAACVRMLGCRDRSELLGKHMHGLIHHTKKDGTPYPLEDCQIYQAGLKGDGAAVDDEVLWRLDRTPFAVEHRSFPLWRGGDRIGAVISFVDVSARRQAEEALRSSEEQLRQAQKMEAIGQLTGGIAHDFNNMLAVILSSASFLVRGLAAADPRREDVEEIALAAKRAASLTRQLLAFSRKQVLEPRLLDLNGVLGNLEKMLRRLVGENIEIATVLPSGLGTVKADAGQLEQVIINLAVNARDAMRGGGKLRIETANVELDGSDPNKPALVQPGVYVLLTVSDTGVGMDAATQKRIFEPFFTTKEKGKGTGLGLSTCYGIVKQSGGYILVQSEPGHGTVFKVYLPRVSDVPLSGAATSKAPARLSGDERVLLVEDDDRVRAVAKKILEAYGYRVLAAPQGNDALAFAAQLHARLDLVLIDIILPGLSGPELVEHLREGHPGIKVLFMTGYLDYSLLKPDAIDPTMNLIQKPFTPETLARKVREVLDG
jgi:two-component system, cell cycle sensor histidine kinase and response regulator CckA